jgi:hypothetical protein
VAAGIGLGNCCEATRKQHMELDITRLTVQKDVKVDLNLKSHRPVFIQDINEMDKIRRRYACARTFQTINTILKNGNVFFSLECITYQGVD